MTKVLVTRQEAADMLSMSLDSFERHVQPEVRLVRQGRLRLVLVTDIEQWANRNAFVVAA